MAYYDALIAKWPSVTGADTTAKLANLNGQTATGAAVRMVIQTYQIYNLIVGTEFAALTAANQQLVRDILGMGTVDASPGTQIRARIAAIFPSGTTTFTNLSTLAVKYDTPQIPWWQANGYDRPIGYGDLALAGISGAMWHYSVVATSGPNNIGATTATVEFWNDAAPDSKVALGVTSVSLSDADIAAWAFRVARDLATRAATQITTGTAQTVSA